MSESLSTPPTNASSLAVGVRCYTEAATPKKASGDRPSSNGRTSLPEKLQKRFARLPRGTQENFSSLPRQVQRALLYRRSRWLVVLDTETTAEATSRTPGFEHPRWA